MGKVFTLVSRLVTFYLKHTNICYNCITISLGRFVFVNPTLNTKGDFQTKLNQFRLKINTFLDICNPVFAFAY